MNWLSFIFGILCLVSLDIILGFVVYIIWKYFDLKYFSEFEITKLKNENEYLKKENQKINKHTEENWGDGYNNLY